jgi:hypothetical protein
MTNKTEDRFYFGKPGQPEKFGRNYSGKSKRLNNGTTVAAWDDGDAAQFVNSTQAQAFSDKHGLGGVYQSPSSRAFFVLANKATASRPGQPERFDMEGACWEGYEPVGTKQKDGRTVPNCVPMKNAAGDEEKFATELNVGDRVHAGLATAGGAGVIGRLTKIEDGYAFIESEWKEKYGPQTYKAPLRLVTKMSRPGQPDTFDASSLDRGSFAEASTSPMLGKLLAAKVMPEGGWRAVQSGSDTLVISFEDADLARDFGRRVASKGYSATSPVATTGRYWNVEVKNG